MQISTHHFLPFARKADSTATCVGESSCEISTKHTGPFIEGRDVISDGAAEM